MSTTTPPTPSSGGITKKKRASVLQRARKPRTESAASGSATSEDDDTHDDDDDDDEEEEESDDGSVSLDEDDHESENETDMNDEEQEEEKERTQKHTGEEEEEEQGRIITTTKIHEEEEESGHISKTHENGKNEHHDKEGTMKILQKEEKEEAWGDSLVSPVQSAIDPHKPITILQNKDKQAANKAKHEQQNAQNSQPKSTDETKSKQPPMKKQELPPTPKIDRKWGHEGFFELEKENVERDKRMAERREREKHAEKTNNLKKRTSKVTNGTETTNNTVNNNTNASNNNAKHESPKPASADTNTTSHPPLSSPNNDFANPKAASQIRGRGKTRYSRQTSDAFSSLPARNRHGEGIDSEDREAQSNERHERNGKLDSKHHADQTVPRDPRETKEPVPRPTRQMNFPLSRQFFDILNLNKTANVKPAPVEEKASSPLRPTQRSESVSSSSSDDFIQRKPPHKTHHRSPEETDRIQQEEMLATRRTISDDSAYATPFSPRSPPHRNYSTPASHPYASQGSNVVHHHVYSSAAQHAHHYPHHPPHIPAHAMHPPSQPSSKSHYVPPPEPYWANPSVYDERPPARAPSSYYDSYAYPTQYGYDESHDYNSVPEAYRYSAHPIATAQHLRRSDLHQAPYSVPHHKSSSRHQTTQDIDDDVSVASSVEVVMG